MKFTKKILVEENGSALVLIAIAMVVMMGSSALVIDYGLLSLKKRTLTNAADAAVLAGAQELIKNRNSPNSAILKAISYATMNGAEADDVTVQLTENTSRISVTIIGSVNYYFARVLGFEKGSVQAEAAAAVGAVSGMTGVVPLAIVEQELIKGQQYELKSFANSPLGPGNFGALALGGSGASNFENNLREGYQGIIRIGDLLDTEPGNMSNPTKRAVTDRINQCDLACTYYSYSLGCSLLVYIPIIKQPTGQGKQKVEVVGFAAFFLNRNQPPGQGNQSNIKGWFVDTIVQGQIAQGVSGYGVSAINLVK